MGGPEMAPQTPQRSERAGKSGPLLDLSRPTARPLVSTVRGLISTGRPIAVDDAEINAIRRLVSSGVPNQPCAFFQVGSRVRIETGALRGLEGILLELKGKRRLVLSITLLQRSVAVEIDSEAVSLLDSRPTVSA